MPEWLRFVRDFVVALGAALIAALITSAVHADLNTVLAVGIGVCAGAFGAIEAYAALRRRGAIPAGTAPLILPAPGPRVDVRLRPERDVVTNRFRLRALNRGGLAHFRAKVTDIRTQDGVEPALVPPGGWSIPWLEYGSVASVGIPTGDAPPLDFAQFNLTDLREDLEGTKWLRGDHWVFPALPTPVKISYSPVRTWPEQDNHHFVVTVCVTRDDPPSSTEARFQIGTERTVPYCREYIGEPPSPVLVPEVRDEPDRLDVRVTAKPEWTRLAEGAYLVAFGVMITNTTSHEITVCKMWVSGGSGDRQALSEEVRRAVDHKLDSMRQGGAAAWLRLGKVRPGAPLVGLQAEEVLMSDNERPRCTLVVMDTDGRTYTAPILWREPEAEGGSCHRDLR